MEANALALGLPIAALIAAGVAFWCASWDAQSVREGENDKEPKPGK